MQITIFGAGYVGFSLGVFLARQHKVRLLEVRESVIENINRGIAPIKDDGIDQYLPDLVQSKYLIAKTFERSDVTDADLVILALPTNFDPTNNAFDTKQLDLVLRDLSTIDPSKPIIIKSTVPVGYTDRMSCKLGLTRCFFSPEFLREGKALYDNLHPSRVVVGSRDEIATQFCDMLVECSHENKVPVIQTSNKEAELIKLASNTYLAMRIAFFNEIDSYSMKHSLVMEDIVSGICADDRIGKGYNNPSFGYGGYCLPKDVQQLQSSFSDSSVSAPLIGAIHKSNVNRISSIIDEILRRDPKRIGIYRVQMKQGSDNFREASNYKILEELANKLNREVLLYEPDVDLPSSVSKLLVKDFDDFLERSDLIVANRVSSRLLRSQATVLTRDIYNEN